MLDPQPPLWTANALAEITGGEWITGSPGDPAILGIELFPRLVERGDLFVVTSPENWGRKFANTFRSLPIVKANAASAAMTDTLPGKLPTHLPTLQVENTREALTKLAQDSRRRIAGKVIGITGSVGKTTTRAMLHHVLSRQGRTSSTEANANTSPGVALSVARTPPNAEFVVYELAHGAMSKKSRIARPHVAMITEIALAHLEEFPTLESIINHKAEILDGLEPEGIAILNRDSATFDRLTEHLQRRAIRNAITFGAAGNATARLTHWMPLDNGSIVQAEIGGVRETYRLSLAGRHMALNSLAVLAGVLALGGDWRQAAADLSCFVAVQGRMEEMSLPLEGGTVRIINDAFNANPASMAAALATLAAATPPGGGRRIAVLGDMKELGADAERLHAALADPVASAGARIVFTLGDQMNALRQKLPAGLLAPHASSVDELAGKLYAALKPGDVVLIKGSHGSHVGDIVPRLLSASARKVMH